MDGPRERSYSRRMTQRSTDRLPPVRGTNHDPLANRLREIERLLDETAQVLARVERRDTPSATGDGAAPRR